MPRKARTPAASEPPPPDIRIIDVANYLKVDLSTVRAMIRDNRLTAYRLGRRIIRLRRGEVDRALTVITDLP